MSKLRRFYKRFSNLLSSQKCIISTTTMLSAVAFVSSEQEPRIGTASRTTAPSMEQEQYENMLDILQQTSAKLQQITSSIKVNHAMEDMHEYPRELDTTLHSEWVDYYDQIDLIFTDDERITNTNDNMRARMERLVRTTQEHLCHEIEQLEMSNGSDAKFKTDLWKRPASKCGVASKHAGGLSKVLVNGNVFEKAGVSVSISSGKLPKHAVQQMTADHQELQKLLNGNKLADEDGNVEYFAASVSSVVHPLNPHAPTGHFNYRYFELGDVHKVWWFGGGGDLSPAVLDETDCKYFHSVFKQCCDRFDKHFYDKFKKWCDDYFVIKHRDNERRGIGGIFFDDLSRVMDENKNELDEKQQKEILHDFVMECASNWSKAYIPLVRRHCNQSYTDEEKEWQQIRRGRYVEFNLVYDRGTKFGLMKPGARIESILMSMPLTARWDYCRDPIHDFEHEIYSVFKTPRDWV